MIPDDEPWWMVRRSIQGDGSVSAAESSDRELSPGIADDIDLERELNALPFRPIGYEW